MKTCEHCDDALLVVTCDACCGRGYLWAEDGAGGYCAVDCWDCGGSGKKADCTNTGCPGIVWYPLSASDATTFRMVVRGIERDEKR